MPAVLDVAGTEQGSGAEGKLEEGDVIKEFQGEPVGTYADLIDGLAETTPGDDVTLGVQRGKRTLDVTITTADNGQRAVLGVFIDPHYDFPVDVSIEIENIGGPSAGTMFALGIIDKLTPEDEANGQIIAGTGTMSPRARSGPSAASSRSCTAPSGTTPSGSWRPPTTATRWSATCPTG